MYSKQIQTRIAAAISILVLTLAPAMAAKHAMVVGISKYDYIEESVNSTSDARAIRDKLVAIGYSDMIFVEEKEADLDGFNKHWTEFLDRIKPGDDVIIYFSGHGFSQREDNYLALRNVKNTTDHNVAVLASVRVSYITAALRDSFVRMGLVILEACRNDPFSHKDHAFGKGSTIVNRLEPSSETTAIVVWYAASEGETSSAKGTRGADPAMSLFTGMLLKHIDSYLYVDIERFAKEIRAPVLEASPDDQQQHPWLASNLTFDWCFVDCPRTDAAPSMTTFQKQPTGATGQGALMNLVTTVSINPSNYEAYVAQAKINGNAVFIGRKSEAEHCKGGESDTHPFGCAILSSLSSTDRQKQQSITTAFVDRPLRLQTDTYLRLGLPTKLSASDNHAQYQCVVGTFGRGSEVTFRKIVAMKYNTDTYYWGVDQRDRYSSCLN